MSKSPFGNDFGGLSLAQKTKKRHSDYGLGLFMHPKEPSDATLVQIENKGGVYSSLMEDLSADLEDNLADVEIDDGSGDTSPPQDV